MSVFNQKFGLLVLLSLTVVACGGDKAGNSDAYQGGSENCSITFVSDYNQVVYQGRSTRNDLSSINEFDSVVKQFANKYSNVNCRAEMKKNEYDLDGAASMINVNEQVATWNNAISTARASIKNADRSRYSEPTPTATPARRDEQRKIDVVTAPGVNDVAVKSLVGKLTARVSSMGSVPSYKIYKDKVIFQSGRIVSVSEVNSEENYCLLSEEHFKAAVEKGALTISTVIENLPNLIIGDASSNFGAGCYKNTDKDKSWTLKDLYSVFGNLIVFD